MPRSSADTSAQYIKREFEEFAYIVSHDLNAPIRHIREFTKLLLGSDGVKISEQDQQYVAFIEGGLDRLEKMQEALLTYSRINTKAAAFSEMDCNRILSDTLKALDTGDANIVVGTLPNVFGDEKQMRMVFFHLLSNALKFRKADSAPVIKVVAEELDSSYIFCVEDNGMGIEPKSHDDAFKLFHRIHLDKSLPGIGAGLAFVKKIVERHGGQTWLESKPGAGTAVFFSLPKG